MQLKIWHKMIIGIMIPSFIALLGVVMTYGYVSAVDNRQRFVQVADDMKEHVLELRRNEKNFLLHKDSGYFKYVGNALSVLDTEIRNISPETIEEVGQKDILILSKSVHSYSELMKNLFTSYQQEEEVVESVRESGRELELLAGKKETEEFSPSSILNLRRLEKNYMLFRDIDSYDRLNKGLLDLTNIVPFCTDCLPYVDAVQRLFQNYMRSDEMVSRLQVIGNTLEEVTSAIALRERVRISSYIVFTKRLLLVALILFCTLGPLFVYKTAMYIVAPINRLAKIAGNIAMGDISLRAPLKEHDETFMLTRAFNTMLNSLQETQKSYEKSIELLHEKQAQLVESEKLASVGRLCAGIAHEINNPLTSVLTFSSLMLETMPPEDQRHDRLKMIVKETTRAKNIVRHVLSFAREAPMVKERININRPVAEIIDSLNAQDAFENIELVTEFNENLQEIFIDPVRVGQVVMNILLNAVHAITPPGRITVETRQDGEFVELVISDTGRGIPEEYLSKIFDPFFTTKDSQTGTGLGLAVSYGIIKKHKGTIEVKSTVGKGTTFIVRLPVDGRQD